MKYMKKAREPTKTPEVELQESIDSVTPGTSNIESLPCVPTSNIQFMASEITSLQDTDFGTLEESGMGQSVLPPLAEKTSKQSQHVDCGKDEETVASTNDSTNTTNTTSTSTVVSANDTQSKSSYRKRFTGLQGESESERMVKYMISQKKLDTVVDKLEFVSNKLTTAIVSDQYEQFGKYIGSLLRGLPIRKVNYLKKKILADVTEAMEGKDREAPCLKLKSTGTQVGLDVLATEKAFKKLIEEQSQPKGLSTNSKSTTINSNTLHYSSTASNIPILGGNMPLLFPGVSNSTASFTLLPVIPMSATPSMVSTGTAAVVTTPSLLGSITSVHSVPVPPSETITTVAKSADGTLLAVTVPKLQMTETPVGPEQSSMQSPRGQKRKQTSAAYLIKKVPCSSATTTTHTVTKSGVDSSLVSHTINHMEIERKTAESSQSQKDSRDSGGEVTICNPQLMRKTAESSQSQKDSRDSGGEVTICNPQLMRQTVEPSQSQEEPKDRGGGEEVSIHSPHPTDNEVEYEMDIEEGNELIRIKQDHDLFETTLCDESSNLHIKEEAPDPEETVEGGVNSPTDTITPSATINCPLCSTQCNSRDNLDSHFTTSHPGSVPPTKDDSGGSNFVT